MTCCRSRRPLWSKTPLSSPAKIHGNTRRHTPPHQSHATSSVTRLIITMCPVTICQRLLHNVAVFVFAAAAAAAAVSRKTKVSSLEHVYYRRSCCARHHNHHHHHHHRHHHRHNYCGILMVMVWFGRMGSAEISGWSPCEHVTRHTSQSDT